MLNNSETLQIKAIKKCFVMDRYMTFVVIFKNPNLVCETLNHIA